MRGIFISYRRDDAEGQAGRLFDELSEHFGRDAVFMDVAGIRKGLDFRRVIDEHVTSCGVLLVLIGKGWLSATDGKGRRRLDDPNDFVRLETAAALSRDIPVVPVLVHGAVMPTEQELPGALKELAFRNGTELTHARWDSDVKLLIEDLRPYLGDSKAKPPEEQPTRNGSPVQSEGLPPSGKAPQPRRSRWAAAGAVVMVGAVSSLGYHLWPLRPVAPVQTLAALQPPPATEVQRVPDKQAVAPLVIASSAPMGETRTPDPAAVQAEADAAKAAAAKLTADLAAERAAATRAAAARREADERRRRDDAVRSAQLAEEQRRREEDARRYALEQAERTRLAAEQAEKNRIAAEQAAGARMFTDIVTTVIGSRQNNRR